MSKVEIKILNKAKTIELYQLFDIKSIVCLILKTEVCIQEIEYIVS